MLESQSHLEGHLRVLHWNSAFIGPLYQKFSRQFNSTFYKQKKKKKSPVESESCYILFLIEL